MSYILEALKQAEEERGSDRLSKVLSVQRSDDQHQNNTDWKKWLTIAIFINAVVLFAWVAWKFVAITADNVDDTQTVKVEPEIPPQRSTMVENNTPVFSKSIKPAAEKVPPVKPTIPEPKVKVPVPAVAHEVEIKADKIVAEKIKPAPLDAEVVMADMVEDQSPGVKSTKQNKPKKSEVVEPVVSAAKIAPLPKRPREELAVEAPKQAFVPEPEILAAPAAPEQIAVVQRPQVPEYAELPYALQQQIPEIRISVHIYNNEPQQRKVRINGQIFREGDGVERNLTVEEITPLGVIFNFEETEFKLNLR